MKVLKWIAISVGSIALLLVIAFQVLKYNTKKASPEVETKYAYNDYELSVWYCSPSKKGREIFGGLEKFGKVWRTGANEATTFTTNTNILFGDVAVSAGTYTLWTIPEAESWTVILNSKMYGWGMDFNQNASREAEFDVANVQVPVQQLDAVQENLVIDFEDEVSLVIKWDKTKVSVPITFNP